MLTSKLIVSDGISLDVWHSLDTIVSHQFLLIKSESSVILVKATLVCLKILVDLEVINHDSSEKSSNLLTEGLTENQPKEVEEEEKP